MDARIRRGILAHENTRKHLSTDTHLESNWQQHAFPVARAVAIPSTVFKEEHKLYANDTTMMLKHYPPAHSDSDIFHTSNTFWNRTYPFIDDERGKSFQVPTDFVALYQGV